jgi:hypothetical protein
MTRHRVCSFFFAFCLTSQVACLSPVVEPSDDDGGCRPCGDGGRFNPRSGELSRCSTVVGSLTHEGRASGRTDYLDATCLEAVTGDFEVSYQLDSLKDLSGLSQLHTVDALRIYTTQGFESLTGMDGLRNINRSILINGTKGLRSLKALSSVENFNGQFVLADNDDLSSLEGLERFRVLRSLALRRNAKLSSLDGLSGLTEVTGDVEIMGNLSLPEPDVTRFLQRVKVGGRVIRR